jgi:hypothetical protein
MEPMTTSEPPLSLRRRVAEDAVQARGPAGSFRLLAPRGATPLEAVIRVIGAAFPQELVFPAPPSSTGFELKRVLEKGWLIAPANPDPDAFPTFGPAVCYVEQGRPLVAAVLLPQLGQVMSAANGLGCRLDDVVLRIEPPPGRSEIVLDGGSLTWPGVDELMRRLRGWKAPSAKLGPLGVSCYLATGRIDAAKLSLPAPDPAQMAAAALIVREAGGARSGGDGRELDLQGTKVVEAASEGLLRLTEAGVAVSEG